MDKDYSQNALGGFLDHAAKTGMLAKNTAQSRKTASQKVLAVLHGEEAADLRKLDFDDVAARFENRHKADYTAQSLRVYQSRTKSAINDFIAWVDDPGGFKPSGKRNGKRAKGSQPKTRNNGNSTAGQVVAESRELPDDNAKIPDGTFNIPIPVRDGYMVNVVGLPMDLRPHEAEKISGVVMAYATNEDK